MVIEEEFKKLESLKIIDDSFTRITSLEIFQKEFNRMSRMDDGLFTYDVEIPGLTSVPCNLNNDDDSKQQMTLGSETRGDDEVELANEDSDNNDEVAEIFRIDTNKDDEYCNGGNLPGAYIVGITLRYQDLEWYEALQDDKLKDEALKNKSIMENN
uniref:Uncharacterized protein n=1 Tax=Tanacetum cinerariifolium TaxID=118510 RepID=A0A6L2KUH0_TANCI|nr:hypothetical protein [Tanacetum cinerariifolium]